MLLEALHVVSIHAACVALHGHGVLLAGDSGAGKSSLAYACARRGWTYCTDDGSLLVTLGTGRSVLGNPRVFRFRQTAAALFPEFSGMEETRRGYGKPTIEVQTAALSGIRTALENQVDHIVFLNRCEEERGHAQLLPVSREEALGRLFCDPWPPEFPAREERQAAVRRLAEAGAHEMRYQELDVAVDCLEQLVLGDSL
jgi:serine kinase of HPr protein (carbohydrate metabolism regulator)